MKNQNSDKEMAELFYNMYMGCITFKEQKKHSYIYCDDYYNKFKYFTYKYIDDQQTK